jgi:hypothetical protein
LRFGRPQSPNSGPLTRLQQSRTTDHASERNLCANKEDLLLSEVFTLYHGPEMADWPVAVGKVLLREGEFYQ